MKIDTGSITPDERGAVNRENRFINKHSHTTRLNEKSAAHLVNARSAPSDWHSTFFLDWIFFPLECEKNLRPAVSSMVEERFYFSTGGVVVSWFCKWVKIPRVFPTMHVHIQHLLCSALRGVECFSALIAPDR